jgi:hypothetical protein
MSDHERFGEFAPLPVESLPGWRGPPADFLVVIEPLVWSIAVTALVLWVGERPAEEQTAELVMVGGDHVGVSGLDRASRRDRERDQLHL